MQTETRQCPFINFTILPIENAAQETLLILVQYQNLISRLLEGFRERTARSCVRRPEYLHVSTLSLVSVWIEPDQRIAIQLLRAGSLN